MGQARLVVGLVLAAVVLTSCDRLVVVALGSAETCEDAELAIGGLTEIKASVYSAGDVALTGEGSVDGLVGAVGEVDLGHMSMPRSVRDWIQLTSRSPISPTTDREGPSLLRQRRRVPITT